MSSFKTPVFYSTDIERDVYVVSNVGRTELKIRCAPHSLHKDFDYLRLHTKALKHQALLRQLNSKREAEQAFPDMLVAEVWKSANNESPPKKVAFACYSSRHEWPLPNLLAEAGLEVFQKTAESKISFKWHPKRMSKKTLQKPKTLTLTKTNEKMEILLKNVKTDKENPELFTAQLSVDGTVAYEVKKEVGEDWVELTIGKHHNAAKLGEKAMAEVERVGWDHLHAYIDHLYQQHLENKLLEKFNKEVEDLCKNNLLFRLSKHTKPHEYEISRMKDTKHHRDYIQDTYDKNKEFGITVVEFINDRFKKEAAAPTDGLFAPVAMAA